MIYIVPLPHNHLIENTVEKESFDYSRVPHNFGLCATADCPYADTEPENNWSHDKEMRILPFQPKSALCQSFCPHHGSTGCQCVRNIPLWADRQLGNQTILSETERRNFTLACRTTKSDGTGQEIGLATRFLLSIIQQTASYILQTNSRSPAGEWISPYEDTAVSFHGNNPHPTR